MNPQCVAKRRNSALSNQAAGAGAVVGQHHRAHLVEQQLLRNPAEPVESALQPFHQHRHRLPGEKVKPQKPGVAQHNHQGMTPAPGKPERPEIHLTLETRRRLEPHHRFNGLARPRRTDVIAHSGVAARVDRRANLIEQTPGRELGKLFETRIDDPLVRVQLVGRRGPWRIPSRTSRQIAVQLARLSQSRSCPMQAPKARRQVRGSEVRSHFHGGSLPLS